MVLPDEINGELLAILGRPCFMCGGIADVMRKTGKDIPRKAEMEQAHVLFYLLKLYAEHGERWAEVGDSELLAAQPAESEQR